MHLTAEQLVAVKNGQPLRFTTAEGEFVVLRVDQLEALRPAGTTEPDLTPAEAYSAIDRAFAEGWDDPKMAEYDRYEEHRP